MVRVEAKIGSYFVDPTGAIVGGILGVFFVMLIFGLVIYFVFFHHK